MNSLKKIFYNIVALTLVATLWLSCKDETEQLNLQRMFRPAEVEIESGQTEAIIAWSPSLFTLPGEVEYLAEVSKDGTGFSSVEVSKTTIDPTIIVSDSEIDIKTDYYVRVKAIGKNGADDSNWLVSEPFQITGQIFILPVQEYDVVADAARIKWQPQDVLTKIIVTPAGGTPMEISITASEAAAGEKIVQGLTPNTNYTAEIFKGDVTKGSVTFTTKSSYAGSNIIDLRGITGKPKILVDTLPDIPSGSVVFLKRGQTYTLASTDPAAARNFSKSVTIISGPDFIAEFARIDITTSFNLAANSVIDSIVFKDIRFRGARAGGESFNNDYIMNVNAVGTVGKIKLENCTVNRFRGTVRLQTGGAGAKVTNYIVNRCVVDSIRDFSVMHSGGASSFANARISNSTFSRCRKFVTHTVAGNNSLVIENCTFNDMPTGGPAGAPVNWLIDFNTFGSATPIILNNCIIGRSWVETAGNTDAGGIRASASTTISVNNTYVLSDFISTNATFQIPGLLAYPKTAAEVYQDPANKDFRIKDGAFPGATSAGDPRWR